MKIIDIQPTVWERLVRAHRQNRVGSAYLFAGPEGSGKEWAALQFAALLNCPAATDFPCGSCPSCIKFKSLQHPNLKLLLPLPGSEKSGERTDDPLAGLSNKDLDYLTEALATKGRDPFFKIRVPRARRILISAIRELRRTIYLKSHEAGCKTILIFDAHLLSEGQGESANALLKVLEEPPNNTILILVTDHKAGLLPTIISRCQIIHFPPLADGLVATFLEEQAIGKAQATFAAVIAQGNMHRALALAELSLEDVQEQTQSLVKQVVRESGDGWRSFIDTQALLATRKPEEFIFHIYLLQLWFHSANRVRSGAPYNLPFPALETMLIDFNGAYPKANLAGIIVLLEKTIESLARNLYTPLTLTNFLLSVQDCIRGKNDILIQ